MMQLKVQHHGEGLHPSDATVAVDTREGRSAVLYVSKRALKGSPGDHRINIGYPLDQDGDWTLVELPRETVSGAMRVWVRTDMVVPEPSSIAAE